MPLTTLLPYWFIKLGACIGRSVNSLMCSNLLQGAGEDEAVLLLESMGIRDNVKNRNVIATLKSLLSQVRWFNPLQPICALSTSSRIECTKLILNAPYKFLWAYGEDDSHWVKHSNSIFLELLPAFTLSLSHMYIPPHIAAASG